MVHHTSAIGVVLDDVRHLLCLEVDELPVHVEEEVVSVLLVLHHGEGLVGADGGEEGRREAHVHIRGGAQGVGRNRFNDLHREYIAIIIADFLILGLRGGKMNGAKVHLPAGAGPRRDGELPPEGESLVVGGKKLLNLLSVIGYLLTRILESEVYILQCTPCLLCVVKQKHVF